MFGADGAYLTLEALTRLLLRSPESLRRKHLSPLVGEGRFALRFPESARREDQGYRSVH